MDQLETTTDADGKAALRTKIEEYSNTIIELTDLKADLDKQVTRRL
jgi:hypothetical protein